MQNRSKEEIFINVSWKHSSGNSFLLLNITFQFARWLPNHLQYPPLGQVWSHGNWTRIGNCWENQEHARASPRWKITLDFFFYFFGILLLKLIWPTVRKSCSSDRMGFFLNSRSTAELWIFFEITRTIFETESFFNLILEVSQI